MMVFYGFSLAVGEAAGTDAAEARATHGGSR